MLNNGKILNLKCFHGGMAENFLLLGYNTTSPGNLFPMFRKNAVPSSSTVYSDFQTLEDWKHYIPLQRHEWYWWENWSTRSTTCPSATLSTLSPMQCPNNHCYKDPHSHTCNNDYTWMMITHFLITLYNRLLVTLKTADLYLFMRSIPTSVIMVPKRDRNWFTGYSVNAIFWTAGNLL